MDLFASQYPRSYSLYFDLNICFRTRKVTGTFEKRAPTGPVLYTGYSPSLRVTRTMGIHSARQWGKVVRDYWGRVSGNLTKRPSRGNPGNPLLLYLKRPLHTL